MYDIEHIISHNIDTIYPTKEAFEKTLTENKLTFYLGIDPTVPDVHLGHAIIYQKLEEFRQLGHTIIFLIGDFTAQIGDPTDKSAARVRLTPQQVAANAQLYKEQISKVLSFDDPDNPAQIKCNSEWLATLTFEDVIELSAHFTVQQMLERDMFQDRLSENKPIYVHEFFYPLMQGYDSVAMDVDVEVGGTDQMFNMMTGRTLLKAMKGKEKFVITCPFLMGTDGKKMSKSVGNYISLRAEPFEMYRQVMTVHDDMVGHYFEMIFGYEEEKIKNVELRMKEDPLGQKKELAFKVVQWLYDEKNAKEAADTFEAIVQNDETPDDIPSVSNAMVVGKKLVTVLVSFSLAESKSAARRLIQQGGVRLNGEKITDINYTLKESDTDIVLQVGKGRYLNIRC